MAIWQFLNAAVGAPLDAPLYDDGGQAAPGSQDFNTEKAAAQMALVPGALGFNYVGQSAPTSGE